MNHTSKDHSRTLLTISTGCIVIYLLTKLDWLILISLILGIIGISSTSFSIKIESLWDKLGKSLGSIVSITLLGIIFYCLLFPIAQISRIFRKSDPMFRKNISESTFTPVNKNFAKDSFEKIW